MGSKGRTHLRLAELAKQQYGVISTRQLEEIGYSRGVVSRAARRGQLHRLHQGVYAVGHRHLNDHGRHLAAVLACEPGAMLSHRSAGWLWGLLAGPSGTIHVTAPTRRHTRPPLRLHFATLAEDDLAICDGIPVTAMARTMLDLAASLSRPRFDRVLERSEERGLFDLGEVDSVLGRVRGHAGAGRMRRAIALYRPPAFTRSQLERRFLELVRDAGLPIPAMNYNLAGYELDAYWEAERFVVELDVYETHGTRAAFERDRLRQEDLKLMGIELIRVTGPRLDREPKVVVDRLATLLARRRHASS
jgi:hypothetical protein